VVKAFNTIFRHVLEKGRPDVFIAGDQTPHREAQPMQKTALITGTSTGFGRATARRLLAAGWNVVATMRDTSDWSDGAADRLLLQPLDVTDAAAIRAAFAAAEARFGGVDAVLNIAGIGLFSVFETTSDEEAREQFETNTFGPMEIMRQAIPILRARGGGHIVNLTSASSTVPEPLMAIYNGSKAALDNMSETVRFELAPQNIVVRIIQPGFVPTTELVKKQWAAAPSHIVLPEYESYFRQRVDFFSSEREYVLPTAEDVAEAILDSLLDTSNRLRWVVGADQVERFHMRKETSESAYDAWGWETFGPVAQHVSG
jgi:NAD(P)-dependent dehydrogenase (short-subunit alcohol dehydrogenase family)